MVQASQKNLWVAASDGDLERVKTLIDAGASPNDRDAHSYTPMHAAASYAHLALLEYLVSVGGDVNLPDDDGDTPLYTCESVEAARWLVEHGAEVGHRNEEGVTAAESLAEDHPAVAAYLRSLTGDAAPSAPEDAVSQHAMDAYASRQTNDLLAQAQEIMAQAERDGSDPDAALRAVVERAVREGFSFGAEQGGSETEEGAKRSRQE
ncbi:ankyrin [Cutaneotrichosporon oleaginosum]|uniref:Ankyrin n=1 Tax=Cutaneotrichosporon oleaginosum TaxID=879819 RepID=A0A0J0XX82_9TREE|nr:ankyrin [Cutaneotrichosporon oleaginosum]KLT45692.1 ankyrin [Cutaneotrichosporon oleaginosum]TXT04519.1 hypothetical protein COLE_07338 [Cutaneotrichosporon oleaginosum]